MFFVFLLSTNQINAQKIQKDSAKNKEIDEVVSTVLKLENPFSEAGVFLIMLRRIATPSKDNLNYQNQKNALDQMKQDPEFGTSENDIQGRIWWDKK